MNTFTGGISIKKLWDEAPFSTLMGLVLIIVYIIQMMYRVILSPGVYTVEQWGALHRILVFDYNEYYRIVTSAFLHWDLLHLISNVVFGLIIITSFLERKIGIGRTMLIYFSTLLLSGLATAALSDYFSSSSTPVWTLGASGAIFGVLGALLHISFYRKDLMTERDIRSIRSLIIMNIVITIAVSNISSVGHFSGLFFGFFVAFLFVPRDKSEEELYFH